MAGADVGGLNRHLVQEESSRVSVVLPTLNGASDAKRLVSSLAEQTVGPLEVIVLDSESEDDTTRIFAEAGAHVRTVSRASFSHGHVRNVGASQATAPILVFMTQDAVPSSKATLERLCRPLLDGRASASYARQVPRSSATPLERFARSSNYPDKSRIVQVEQAGSWGIRSIFFSNACSAIRRDAFESVGGFPETTIMNEDMLIAARLLKGGHTIAYVAEAVVEHSHDYSVVQILQRYFDIGVFLSQAEDELDGMSLTGDGVRYVEQLLTHLVREGAYHWIPAAVAESLAKFLGVTLGRRYRRLPLTWTRRLSMHPSYWRDQRSRAG